MFLGSLATSMFDSEAFLVGASGAVYALIAAHLANILLVSITLLIQSTKTVIYAQKLTTAISTSSTHHYHHLHRRRHRLRRRRRHRHRHHRRRNHIKTHVSIHPLSYEDSQLIN